MADFCRQCSIEIFGEDCGDLKGLSAEQDTENGLYAGVLCEGCGPTLVNHIGVCINKDCLKGHGEKADTDLPHVPVSN